ncbi:MAG: hypothetical protein NT069_29845 [Planctomycetota bacterium]|nr:hypothetical protein [Planctomycetota bacterium]
MLIPFCFPDRPLLNRLLCGLALCGLAIGCESEPVFTPLSFDAVAAETPYVNIRAKQLQERYRVTPHATNRELLGKVIEVEGMAAVVGRQPTGQWFITLHGGAKDKLPIQCFVDDEEPWKRVSPGMALTLKGQVMKTLPKEIPRLLHCTIVSIDEELTPAKRLPAAELCRQYLENHAQAQNDYYDQWAWVTGQIASIDKVNGVIYMDGLGTTQIHCVPADEEETMKLELERGQTIMILGKVVGGDRLRIRLRDCLPPCVVDQPQ